jgi:nesprin-1
LVEAAKLNLSFTVCDPHSSTLESVIDQWNDYLEKKSQLEQWMESVDQRLEHPLQLQPGLKEKFSLLDHFQSIVSEAEDHTGALQQLAAKSRELYQKTQDESFKEAGQEELRTQFQDIMTVAKVSFRPIQKLHLGGEEPPRVAQGSLRFTQIYPPLLVMVSF